MIENLFCKSKKEIDLLRSMTMFSQKENMNNITETFIGPLTPWQNLNLDNLNGEEWKDVKGWENFYQISNWGRVKSVKKDSWGVARNQILRQHPDKDGYLRVLMYMPGIQKNYIISRLVAENFCENSQNYNVVHHKNEIRWFNYYENLEWTTSQRNAFHRTKKHNSQRQQKSINKKAEFDKIKQDIEIRLSRQHKWSEDVEIWKEIPGFNEFEASNLGKIRHKITKVSKPQKFSKDGYELLSLRDVSGKNVSIHVHKLICLAFHGEPPTGKTQVNHINNIKNDNKVNNLEWCSKQENTEYRKYFSYINNTPYIKKSKLTPEKIVEIRQLYSTGEYTQTSLGRKFGVSAALIHCVVTFRSYSNI